MERLKSSESATEIQQHARISNLACLKEEEFSTMHRPDVAHELNRTRLDCEGTLRSCSGLAGSSERVSSLLGTANRFSPYLPVTVYYRHVSCGELVLLLQAFTWALLLCAANLSRNQRHTRLKGEALAHSCLPGLYWFSPPMETMMAGIVNSLKEFENECHGPSTRSYPDNFPESAFVLIPPHFALTSFSSRLQKGLQAKPQVTADRTLKPSFPARKTSAGEINMKEQMP
ncbi:hypothetical protein P7K49_038178 [Saguinus oedipus]|uniref:Uncharacterized protein n=1 Tax=Saguinus oedipus TaxID=9490 RepID=A0ABQ9TFC7_SAGOE|nr:hypothetical protein P7K49_038178 [Saguinus oedipus]